MPSRIAVWCAVIQQIPSNIGKGCEASFVFRSLRRVQQRLEPLFKIGLQALMGLGDLKGTLQDSERIRSELRVLPTELKHILVHG